CCDPKAVYAMGESAGGLLIAGAANLRPDLYYALIASMPFVDVTTAMSDDRLPLTTIEYGEWGDPRLANHYDNICSYSPYDTVPAGTYPHLLAMTALQDSRVPYWHAAKWVARIRARADPERLILLYTDTSSGHGGPTTSHERYRNVALRYSFITHLRQRSRMRDVSSDTFLQRLT